MATQDNIRNLAIIAHIDHGKSTLCDAMLQQTGTWREGAAVEERVMDDLDQEKERGITIRASNCAVDYKGVKLNIIDTPGHADFSENAERSIKYMADGCALLVDASEGPLPQTRHTLRKALEARIPIILVINKIDRPDAEPDRVVDQVYELFLDLDADEEQIEFPILYTNAREGTAGTGIEQEENLVPLFETILEHIPPPQYEEEHPLQARVVNLDASPYLGRIAICKIHQGILRKGDSVAWCHDDKIEYVKLTELYATEGVERVPITEAGPGDIVAVAGIENINIGHTLADPHNSIPLPVVHVDEPNMSMTIGVNKSPLAGKSGNKLTARQIKGRLDQELLGNIALQVKDTEAPDAWEVLGRGELQLAVLIESMRREGFELTIGKPQVVVKEIEGKPHEPIEHVVIDIPEEFMGVVTQLLAVRKGKMEQMINHNTGWVRLEFTVPARGLLGFRTEFLTETRGTGILNHSQEGYAPWFGNLRTRRNGTLVADRKGVAAAFSIFRLQERGLLFVLPGEEVYEGMIVGENARDEDMSIDICRVKAQSNVRSSGADEAIKLVPATRFSLEQCLEFIDDDEFIEICPDAIRLRKTILNTSERLKAQKKAKN